MIVSAALREARRAKESSPRREPWADGRNSVQPLQGRKSAAGSSAPEGAASRCTWSPWLAPWAIIFRPLGSRESRVLKRPFAFLVKSCGVLLLGCLPAMAAVTGTVVNRTTGQPQAGATVGFFKLVNAFELAEQAQTDDQGKFTINQKVAKA